MTNKGREQNWQPVEAQKKRGGYIERAIIKCVMILDEAVGLIGLSAHDCRHYWAAQAARNSMPVDHLQDAGGWNSPAMPLRYGEAATSANDGVKLGDMQFSVLCVKGDK